MFPYLSESTRNAEIRDAYAVNERENRQIVKKKIGHNLQSKTLIKLLLIRVGRVFSNYWRFSAAYPI